MAPPTNLARDWVGRFVAVQGFDRAMAIGAYAYSALIPLLIVYSSVLSRQSNRSFADDLIRRFDLKGSAAAGMKLAFAPSGTVQSGVTVLGIALLLVSALSFTRALQRLYELAFGLPSLGLRNSQWGLLWLVVVCVETVARPWLLGDLSGSLELIGSLALGIATWLATPYLLLGRRIAWKRLAPTTLLSVLGMTAVGVWSEIWLPHTISASAAQYGLIGIGFALLTWLVGVGVVLVLATTGGAMIDARLHDPAVDDAIAYK